MANFETTDLMAVGKHCSVKECRRLDFLPFECEHCKDIFCLDHRRVEDHRCSSVIVKDRRIPICPLCDKKIIIDHDATINDQVEKHIMSGCKTLVAEKRKKNRCSHGTCRQHSLIPFTCDRCFKSFCVRHRHSGDHNCIGIMPTNIAVH